MPSYLLKWVKVYCLLVSGKTIFYLGTVNIAMEGVFVVCVCGGGGGGGVGGGGGGGGGNISMLSGFELI